MVEVAERRTLFHESSVANESDHLHSSEGCIPVLGCYYPDCSNEATQLCNRCGELFCSEHSAAQQGAGSTVIFYRCSACANKAHRPASQFLAMSVLTIIGLVGTFLTWYAYTR